MSLLGKNSQRTPEDMIAYQPMPSNIENLIGISHVKVAYHSREWNNIVYFYINEDV